jgi:TP901 family phage tail tape measure protein
MTNINVRIQGTANVTQMSGAFGKLQAQIAAVNAQLEQMIALSKGVDPVGYERVTAAAAQNAKVYRNAAASTGMFEVQQLKLNKATDDYIKKLKSQQLSFRELVKQRKVASKAYREQLAMENMVVRQSQMSSVHGKQMLDVTYPREVAKEMDTAGRRVAFLNEQLKSGAHQMVNWGKNTQWAGRQLSMGLTLPIAAFGAAAGVMAYQVDKQLTRIAKVYDTTADQSSGSLADITAAEKELMRVREAGLQTALKSAREYGSAAQDTLSVQAELAATGLAGADLQKATAEVMRISRLGELEYQDAINATISLQSVFRMNTEELTESFNYMNAVENATSLQTVDFAKAIPIAAGPVKAFGGDIKELGVLLTAMRERGTDAVSGANAIKAAMQRLGRPSKQVKEEFQAITGTDITQLVDTSESLTEIFERIGAVTSDLSAPERRDVFAGLFGSYQVTRMMNLVDGMDALAKGQGQVATAAELASQSSTKWADTAAREIERYQKSVSGQWDIALNEMKLILSEFGEPFIEIATSVIKAVSGIMKAFLELPGPVQKVIAVGVGLAALAGPLVMLTGLFANLIGNGIKMGAALTSLFVKMNILDKESRASQLATKLQTEGFISQTTAVRQLTLEIEKLALAQRVANGGMVTGAYGPAAPTPAQWYQMEQEKFAKQDKRGRKYYAHPTTGMNMSTAVREQMALNALHAQALNMDRDRSVETKKISGNIDKSSRGMQGAALAGGVFAGAMTASMLSSNKTVDNIAQFAILATVVVPAAQMLVPLLSAAGTKVKDLATKMKAANASTAGASVAGSGLLSSVRGLVNPVGLAAAGLAAGAFAMYKLHQSAEEARKEQELALKVTREAQADVLELTRKWADETGRAYKNYVSYNNESRKDYNNKKQMQYLEMVDTFENEKTSVTQDGKTKEVNTVDYFNTQPQEAQMFTLQNMAREALVNMKMNFGEAKQMIVAFLDATGKGFDEAELMAATALHDIGGTVENLDWAAVIDQGFAAIKDAAGNRELSDEIGDNLGTTIGIALDKAKSVTEREQILSGLEDNVIGAWGDIQKKFATELESEGSFYDTINASMGMASQETKQALASQLEEITSSADNFRTAVIDGTFAEIYKKIYEFDRDSPLAQFFAQFAPAAKEVEGWERSTVSSFGKVFGFADNVDTLRDALGQTRIELMRMGKAAATNEFLKDGGILDTARDKFEKLGELSRDNGDKGVLGNIIHSLALSNTTKDFNDQLLDLKAYLEQIDISKLDKDTKNWLLNLERAYDIDFKGIGEDIEYIDEKADDAAGTRKIDFDVSVDETRAAMQNAMSSVQQDIADQVTDNFDRQMNAAIDSRQSMWDRKSEALNAELDRRGEALDTKWENRKTKAEEYWDRRTEAVEDAIDAEQKAEDKRQRMFDAEIARIQRLNEAMNRNIDFNVALSTGNFDEAAKIRNDAMASADTLALERAADKSGRRSERRIDTLEGRKEIIDEAREQHMEALEDREEAERKHLERISRMREKALERQTDADMEAQRAIWDARKDSLEDQTDLFLSWTGRNLREVQKHAKMVGGAYADFGKNTLMPMGEKWSEFYHKRLYAHVKQASWEIRSDKMWEQMGKVALRDMLKGIGFQNLGVFKTFMKTGEVPNNFGYQAVTPDYSNKPKTADETRHEGGFVGSGGGSRKGVARTLRGLHSSERLVRAQQGEFLVPRKAAAQNAGLLESITKGDGLAYGTGGLGGPGMAGVALGTAAKLLSASLKKPITDSINRRVQQSVSAYSGPMGSRDYYLPGVMPWVAEAADYLGNKFNIASILGVGSRSNVSEHPLGRALDFMTTDIPKGTALADEVVKRHRALDAMYVIWRQRINSFDSRGWRVMEDRGSPTANHMDHVHVSFDATGDVGDLPALAGGFTQGSGGRHRPVRGGVITSGLHPVNAIDLGVPTGTPVYSAADGIVSASYDLRGFEPRQPDGGNGFKSYGRVVVINHGDFQTLYAHLSQRFAQVGQSVKGGARLGLSGDTGNSSGPHLHFGAPGSNPYAFLKKGGTVLHDNTPAVLHKNERVLTAPLTKKLDDVVDSIWQAAKKGKKKRTTYSLGNGALILGSADEPRGFENEYLSRRGKKKGVSNVPGGIAHGVKIGTYNVHWGTSNENSQKDLLNLMSSADVLSLQELGKSKRALLPWLNKKGWGTYSPSYGTGLAWNKASITGNNFGSQRLSKSGIAHNNAVYGRFSPKGGGSPFWNVSAHTIWRNGAGAATKGIQAEQYRSLASLNARLSKDGSAVIMGGDFNLQSIPVNQLEKILGMKSNRRRGLDHLFYSNAKGGTVSTRNLHSDHPGVLSNFNIPGLSKGAMNIDVGGLARLHEDEGVLSKDYNDKFKRGIDRFANGGDTTYNAYVNVAETNADPDAIAEKVIVKMQRMEKRRPQSRRGS